MLFMAIGRRDRAVVSIPLAAVAGPPYLSLESLSPWIVTLAIGMFTALFATPFAIHGRLSGELERDARWERALLLWGAVAIGVLAVGVVCGLPSGFDSSSLAGAIGIVADRRGRARARHACGLDGLGLRRYCDRGGRRPKR